MFEQERAGINALALKWGGVLPFERSIDGRLTEQDWLAGRGREVGAIKWYKLSNKRMLPRTMPRKYLKQADKQLLKWV